MLTESMNAYIYTYVCICIDTYEIHNEIQIGRKEDLDSQQFAFKFNLKKLG